MKRSVQKSKNHPTFIRAPTNSSKKKKKQQKHHKLGKLVTKIKICFQELKKFSECFLFAVMLLLEINL